MGAMRRAVTIVDYGMGNLHTVRRKLERIGASPVVTSDPVKVQGAERLVLPGVGHFGRAMANLAALHLVEALAEAAQVRRVPVLGICLGMQLLARRSEEGDAAGLGWIEAEVVRFAVPDPRRIKVPHMGWNDVIPTRPSDLLRNLPPRADFYFVHSYHVVCRDPALALGETDYAYRFTSVVERDNVVGVQFHPEKSHDAGDRLLENFLAR